MILKFLQPLRNKIVDCTTLSFLDFKNQALLLLIFSCTMERWEQHAANNSSGSILERE